MAPTESEVLRAIGRLEGKMEAQGTDLTEIKAEQRRIHTRLTELATNGCAYGASNARRIVYLEQAPKRRQAGSAMAGGGIVALVVAGLEAVRRLWP